MRLTGLLRQLYRKGPVIIATMQTRTRQLALGLLAALIGACTTPRAHAPEDLPPVPIERPDTQAIQAVQQLNLSGGTFQYRLTQHTTITTQASIDTNRNTIAMRALLIVQVSPQADSTYDISISVDSLQMNTEGAVPAHPLTGSPQLSEVLRMSFGPKGNHVTSQLPDSLCAYAHFPTIARDLLLPQLTGKIITQETQLVADTVRTTACRAGARIDIVTTRHLIPFQNEPLTLALHGAANLNGAGTLGRDSVQVSGSISTRGRAVFTGASRLPVSLETESDGLIAVTLGDSTTVFRQLSVQHIQKQPSRPN